MFSWRHPCQHFESLFEPKGVEGFPTLAVVERIVGVEPVALSVHGEVCDLGALRRFEKKLPLRNERSNDFDFGLVQMKLAGVELPIHVGVGKEEFGRAAFDDYIEDVRAAQFVERLRGQNHGGVCFSPGLECLDNVSLNARILQEDPGFVDEESLEGRGDLAVGDDRVRAMQDVEKQGFEKLRILAQALEVEALKS